MTCSMDITEYNKTNTKSYLEFVINSSLQKNYKTIPNLEKNLLKCLKKIMRTSSFFLARTTILEGFTYLTKNLLGNKDTNRWINMLFYRRQKIGNKSVAKVSHDKSCQYNYSNFKSKYFVLLDSYWKIQKTKLITKW